MLSDLARHYKFRSDAAPALTLCNAARGLLMTPIVTR
jgi:hypothetical protein